MSKVVIKFNARESYDPVSWNKESFPTAFSGRLPQMSSFSFAHYTHPGTVSI